MRIQWLGGVLCIGLSASAVALDNYTPAYTNQLKQRLSVQLNSKWQLGLDSFKATPLNKQLIDWPGATQPKEGQSSAQRGYGLGIKMKLD